MSLMKVPVVSYLILPCESVVYAACTDLSLMDSCRLLRVCRYVGLDMSSDLKLSLKNNTSDTSTQKAF